MAEPTAAGPAAGPAGRGLVILPTYNEIESLERVVRGVLDRDGRLSVLVVDDGSPDGTGDLADRLAGENDGIHVLHREGKQGLGSAYIAGFRWALERDYAWVFEMDADGSHDADRLPDMIEATRTYDVVVGSRYLRGVNVINWPMSRLLLSYYANRYARCVTGLRLADSTSGFKCFKREVLAAIDLTAVGSTGYAFQIEMNFRAWKKGFAVGEIPIVFVDREAGQSKMSGAIVREAVWRVWALRLRSLLGRL
ncbi:MAG: polyprenol monophosphomannose synthase [Gemmatimonadota bacterium]|nr:polyprenol monophosphomannose synthase [Gemmatimonadota bacterium]